MKTIDGVELLIPDTVFGKAKIRLTRDHEVRGVTIPAGYVTDGATSPRFLWAIFPPVSAYWEATLLHDWMLHAGHDRKYADHQFAKTMKELGIHVVFRAVMFYSVRIYGIMVKSLTTRGE